MDEQAMQPARPAAVQWTDMLHAIFPEGVPPRHVWPESEAILELLQRIAAGDAHRAYAPDGHCFTLLAAEPAGEPGCLALRAGDTTHIAKPARLVFEAVNEEDLSWAWFRLETEALPATGKDPRDADYGYERLLETAPGEYTAQDLAAPVSGPGGHLVIRHLCGMFVFLSKDSPYQLGHETETEGRHTMRPSSFRQALAKMADVLFKTANP